MSMEKKKSAKKINKTLHIGSKKQQQPRIPVQTIMKEIGELKKELVSIKSKKYLHLSERQDNHKQPTGKQKQQVAKNEGKHSETIQESGFAQELKENSNSGKCYCRGQISGQKTKIEDKKKAINVQIFHITAPKSRQTKLKLNIQLNRIKSSLQKIKIESQQTESLQLLASQVNSTMIYINSIVKQYQDQISGKREQFKEMREELSELSNKILKLAEKHSNQKHLGELQVGQIAELKRHLSYYMSLMKDSKEEAEKYSKEYTDLQAYAKELENSNQLLRAQIKRYADKYSEISIKLKQSESSEQKICKERAQLQSDLHLVKIQSQKHRQKRRQLQKVSQQIHEQLKEAVCKLNKKQRAIAKIQQEKKELEKTIQSLKHEQKNMVVGITNKKLTIEKMEQRISVLETTLQQKQQAQAEKDEEINQLKQMLEAEIKQTKKNANNLEFYQLQINSLSEEIDELRRANERYKNQHFRNKLVDPQHESETGRNRPSDQSKNVNIKNKLFQQETALKSQNKNRKKILGEIQELIEKHRRSSDSESQNE